MYHNPTSPPESLSHPVHIDQSTSREGWNIFRITPSDVMSDKQIVYFHGGAFVWHMLESHWEAVATIAVEANSEIVIPAYPLAPHETAINTVPKMANLLKDLIDTVGSDSTFLMGDSAGGNLALSCASILRDQNIPRPAATFLISPWLDLGLPDSEVAHIDAPGMRLDRLRRDADQWRGTLSLEDPLVSPLQSSLHGLGKVVVFCGTKDLVNPGCQRLEEIASGQQGTDITYYETPGERHSHVLSNRPAGVEARRLIYDML